MKEIGETLKEARESIGVSIEEVAGDLKVRPNQIENIEAGNMKAFKDVLYVKGLVKEYSKYLGLNYDDMIDEFNEYMFEYTSKIPIKEIEKTIELKIKEEDKKEEIASPYTKQAKKYNKWVYIILYIALMLLILFAIIWSVKQVTINKKVTDTISYGR